MTTDRTADTTAPPARLVVRQKILLAAVSLGPEPFLVDVLCARVWDLFPESFSLVLPDARKLPDSNRVRAKLSGPDGLCGRGWLVYEAEKTYSVTRAGRIAAKPLLHLLPGEPFAPPPPAAEEASPSATPTPSLPVSQETSRPRRVAKKARPEPVVDPPAAPAVELLPDDLRTINALAKCDALRKFLRGSPLVFADACAFWGFSPKRPADVQPRIDASEALLKRVVTAFGADATVTGAPSLSTCYGLLNLHRLMLGRFGRELDAVRAGVLHA